MTRPSDQYAAVPTMRSREGIMAAILVNNLALALFRFPAVELHHGVRGPLGARGPALETETIAIP